MSYMKEVGRILLFSVVMTGALALLMLPYGFFLIPMLVAVSYYFFFIPIFIVSSIMFLIVNCFKSKVWIKVLGAITSLSILSYTANIIYNDRGTSEYFGNHWMTYSQLVFAAVAGFFLWSYLAEKLLFAKNDPHKLYSYRD